MGLDMFLTAEIDTKDMVELKVECKRINDEEFNLPTEKLSTLSYELGYWRKSYAIYEWFNNFFRDNNGSKIWISVDDLYHLDAACQAVLDKSEKSHKGWIATAKEFFHSTTCNEYIIYDKHYLDELKYTREVIAKCFEFKKKYDYIEFYYEASW